MPPLLPLFHVAVDLVRARLADRPRHRRDAGYTTETLVATALLVTVAVTALGILSAKVIAKATGINL
jgi:hypothetical protein